MTRNMYDTHTCTHNIFSSHPRRLRNYETTSNLVQLDTRSQPCIQQFYFSLVILTSLAAQLLRSCRVPIWPNMAQHGPLGPHTARATVARTPPSKNIQLFILNSTISASTSGPTPTSPPFRLVKCHQLSRGVNLEPGLTWDATDAAWYRRGLQRRGPWAAAGPTAGKARTK